MRQTEEEKTNWWLTLPGLLTALASLITALTGLYLAIKTNQTPDPCKLPFDQRPLYCLDKDKK
jgi:hypothetical protein